jgi:ribosomal protein S8
MKKFFKVLRKLKKIKLQSNIYYYPINLYTLLTKLKQGVEKKKIYIDIPYDKKTYKLLNFFLIEGFITKYYLYKNFEKKNYYNIRVYLKYTLDNTSVITKINFISKKKKNVFYTHKQLLTLYKKNPTSVIFIQTIFGIFSLSQLIKFKIGGILLFYIQ